MSEKGNERERGMYANQATFLKDGESQVSNSWVRGQCDK